MKVISKACQVIALLGAAAALVLFFTDFADIVTKAGSTSLTGATMAFTGKNELAAANMARSTDIWFCCILTIAAVLFGGLGLKFKGSRVAELIFAAVPAVYMLVAACSVPGRFVDTRPLADITSVSYSKPFLLTTVLWVSIALFVCAIGIAANILLDDYIKVRGSKGSLTIFGKVKRFVLDYKSEIKKIVWFSPNAVLKNTLIVIIVCVLFGAFVWLLDFGLGSLIGLIK